MHIFLLLYLHHLFLPARTMFPSVEKLSFKPRTSCLPDRCFHLQGPGPGQVDLQLPALTLASGSCHSAGGTWCPLRRAINHNYNWAWESLILPLWGSLHSSPPSRPLPSSPVATPVQEINVAVQASIYLAQSLFHKYGPGVRFRTEETVGNSDRCFSL